MSSNPSSSLDSILNRLLEELLRTPEPDKIQQRIQTLQQERPWKKIGTYTNPAVKQVGQRRYDQLIESLFTATNSGITREALLDEFLHQIQQPGTASPLLFGLVLERDPLSDPPGQIEASHQIGLQPDLWHNWRTQETGWLQRSPLLLKTLQAHEKIEFGFSPLLREYDDYRGEFDTLLQAQRHHTRDWRSARFWLNAVPLPSEHPNYPDRALYLLYPAFGDELSPQIPAGATQEWRCLHFLTVAYRFLDHQLRNINQHIHQNRQTLLTELAPGILHHEIGAQTQAISSYIEIQAALHERLAKQVTKADLQRLGATIHLLDGTNKRLYAITDAFNNLERRSQGEPFQLQTLFTELKHLLKYRLARSGIKLQTAQDPADLTLTSDSALLTQLLTNLVLNAINALDEAEPETQAAERCIRIQAIQAQPTGPVWIHLQNNGPGIPARIKKRIFQRGFTTRINGHGQGLYIARLVASYLVGHLTLIPEAQLDTDMHVGFMLELVADRHQYMKTLTGEKNDTKR